jgi:hypothetical protein
MAAFFGFFKRQINKEWNQMVDDKITSFSEDKIGDNEYAQLHVEYSELDDFKFLEFSIVGQFKIKTLKGAIINFEGGKENLKLNTDSQEIDSDFSEASNQGVTLIDVEVTEELIHFLNSETLMKISFEIENKKFIFNISEPLLIFEKIQLFSQT